MVTENVQDTIYSTTNNTDVVFPLLDKVTYTYFDKSE